MIFFFKYFNNDIRFLRNYENLSSKDFSEFKKSLNELKSKNIYNYQHKQKYFILFNCLYNKNEAIKFLKELNSEDFGKLKEKILTTDSIITKRDIDDAKNCWNEIHRMQYMRNSYELFEYIKSMKHETFYQFENYSKVYSSIIDLIRYNDEPENIYIKINNIIKDANFNILRDSENFCYTIVDSKKKENINLTELIELKNRICTNEISENKEKYINLNSDDVIQYKRNILIFFKTIISNIENILEYMSDLAKKVNTLDIIINIQINIENNKPSIIYNLNSQEKSFEDIMNYLKNVDDVYKKQLNSAYDNTLIIYIRNVLGKLFCDKEKYLYDVTTEIILTCQKFLREKLNPSSISFKELNIFTELMKFFNEYFEKKNKFENRIDNKQNNKLRSIICSTYLSYYFNITDSKLKNDFEIKLRKKLLKLINNTYVMEIEYEDSNNLIRYIKNEELSNEIKNNKEEINDFIDFIKVEGDYLINQIELEKGIGKTSFLKLNIFILFVTIITRIPLIITGKPGSSKRLSLHLINKSMEGEYSKNKFFRQFPRVIQTFYASSKSTKKEDIENIFFIANKKLNAYKGKTQKLPISLVIFDDLGLINNSVSDSIGIINSKIGYGYKNNYLSFVGISDVNIDDKQIDKSLFFTLNIPEPKLDEIIEISYNIVESISKVLKYDNIFETLSYTYFEYKRSLQIIKESNAYIKYKNNESSKNQKEKISFEEFKKLNEFKDLMREEEKNINDFHSIIDFYYLIKGITKEIQENNDQEVDKISIIINNIERNFGGKEYKIDFDLYLLNYIILENKTLDKIMEENPKIFKIQSKKIYSYELFKEVFNLQYEKIKSYINIKNDKPDLIKCIDKNIKDINGRFLLVETSGALENFIYQIIRLLNPDKKIIMLDESPFDEDKVGKEYGLEKLNQIIGCLREENIIIINNLNRIHPFLYNLYRKNYQIINEKKYIRIILDNINEKLFEVNPELRIVLLVDKNLMNNFDFPILNRLEKIKVSLDRLLDDKLLEICDDLFRILSGNLANYLSYSLKDLLINCQKEEIQELICYYKNAYKHEEKEKEKAKKNTIDYKKIKDIIIQKIYKILPQDIVANLQDDNIFKKNYYESKNLYNFNDYLYKLKNKNEKISIIYTFSSIKTEVIGLKKDFSIIISEINSEKIFKHLIDEIKNKQKNINDNDYMCFHFSSSNTNCIKFISNYILQNSENENYKYIFIIHINRNFNKENNERRFLSDINPDIYQIFIDNLNGNNQIKLNDLLNKRINNLLDEFKDKQKFENNLNNFINKKIENNILKKEIEKNVLIQDIIPKLFKDNYINNHTIDIVS